MGNTYVYQSTVQSAKENDEYSCISCNFEGINNLFLWSVYQAILSLNQITGLLTRLLVCKPDYWSVNHTSCLSICLSVCLFVRILDFWSVYKTTGLYTRLLVCIPDYWYVYPDYVLVCMPDYWSINQTIWSVYQNTGQYTRILVNIPA